MKSISYYASPIGTLGIVDTDGALSHILFESQSVDACTERETEITALAIAQLSEYFAGTRREFTVPLAPIGTPFQRTVWTALQAIAYGQTSTYGDVAAAVGNPKAFRAVGMANNRNRLPIIYPCHRVVGADGSLTGYAGGLEAKRFLLDLEKNNA